MSRVIETTIYKFNELTEKAKEKAREWYREGALNYDWWDMVYQDAEAIANILGIQFKQREEKLMSGKTRVAPCIWLSGF